MPTLNWIGKEAVVNHHQQVPFHLLKDVPDLACGDPGSGNLIVQGDNLIALKALLPYYAGQVKCIYIDPPYNTGNENWVYNDNVNSPILREWLGKVVGGEGETLDRHDRWLCMMYPRLSLLQHFMREDGVVIVSIDDFESYRLRCLMDEVFGSSNFIAQLVWDKTRKNDAKLERIIIPVQGSLPLGAHPQTVQLTPSEIDLPVAKVQVDELGGKVRLNADTGEITVLVPLDEQETEKLVSCAKTPEAKAKVEEIVALVREREKAFGGTGKTRLPSPYEQQLDFLVPLLCIRENGMLFEFESTFLIEHLWKLSEKDATLSSGYNPLLRPTGKAGYLDVGTKGEVQSGIVEEIPGSDFVGTLHQQVLQLGRLGDWTLEVLVAWLDRHIDHQDIPLGESAEFLRKVARGLIAQFGISDVSILALDRFRLRDEIETRIQQHRDSERQAAFQMFLLPESLLTVSDECALNFKTMTYEPSWLYEGGFQFKKHYFGPKPGELREKTPSGFVAEEFKCAQFLDGALPEVKFWLRNLPRKASSFRLQTSTDWFYPDFLCQLVDGRVLAVEYKGKYLYDAVDAEEKRAVGTVWASRSAGRCVFVMPTEGDFSAITRAIARGQLDKW